MLIIAFAILARAPNCETISRFTKPYLLRVAGIFTMSDKSDPRDWNVKEPVPRLENRDIAALKCIRSQKNVRSAVARADRGEYLRRGGMHIQDRNDAISMAHT